MEPRGGRGRRASPDQSGRRTACTGAAPLRHVSPARDAGDHSLETSSVVTIAPWAHHQENYSQAQLQFTESARHASPSVDAVSVTTRGSAVRFAASTTDEDTAALAEETSGCYGSRRVGCTDEEPPKKVRRLERASADTWPDRREVKALRRRRRGERGSARRSRGCSTRMLWRSPATSYPTHAAPHLRPPLPP